MLILEPISKERIWGTPRLHDYSGDSSIDLIGSLYTVSAIEGLSNTVRNGEFEGIDLFSLVKSKPELFGLVEGEEYPIIISFTSADSKVSIQVHPTDDYAIKNLDNNYGKSESWYFIEEPTDKWVYSNCLLSDKSEIKEKIQNNLYEDVVDKVDVDKGDVVYIPSGTLHSLTPGSLVYEIQQSTDITYRFYDYNRVDKDGKKRELHLEQALDTLNTKNRLKRYKLDSNEVYCETPYDLCRKFASVSDDYKNHSLVPQAVTVLSGELSVEEGTIKKGESLILFPGEHFLTTTDAEIMIATPNYYWRDDKSKEE